jgi:hypothetical protein
MKYVLAKVVEVTPLPDHRLALKFADGAEGIYDCKPLLWGELFEPLKDPKFFAQVRLDHGAPAWPNGADLDAAVLRSAVAKPAAAGRKRKPAFVHEEAAPYETAGRSSSLVDSAVHRSRDPQRKDRPQTGVKGNQ